MASLHASRFIRLGITFGLGSLLASSCVVDTSGLIFDDDAYQAALGGEGGEGGVGPGSGGVHALGGGGGLGGETSSGGIMNLGGSGPVCTNSEMRCEGKQVELCTGNDWLAIGGECPNACVNGLCVGVCNPGSDACLSSIETQHCNAVGEWEPEFCEFACVDGACGGVCRPGDRGCSTENAAVRQLCLDTGEWEDQETCPGECDLGVCVGACTLGDKQCGGDTGHPVSITCDDVDWESSTPTDCPFICDEASGECGGECVPFSAQCASSTSVEVCDSTAVYGEPVPCDYVCVEEDKACGGECKPGTKRCNGTSIETCGDDGMWAGTSTCSGSEPICLEATPGEPACVACAPGAKKCAPSANQVLTCSESGSWPATGSTCKSSKLGGSTVCWAGACEDTTEVCPTICLKGGCPKGCGDADTRWYCSSGTFTAANCAALTPSCVSGVCQ